MKTHKPFFLAVFAVLCAASAFADSPAGKGYTTREYPWVMRSTAALGMGNAYYTKSDSKYAPFYNPAGLARIKGSWRLDLLPLAIGPNGHIINFAKDAQSTDTSDNSELAELFKRHIGNEQFMSVALYPGFTKKNFTLGIFAASQLNAQVANPVLPEVNADAFADTGAVIGYAHSFLEDKLQAGVALRGQERLGYRRSFLFSDFANDEISNIADKGMDNIGRSFAVLIDAGVIYNFSFEEYFNPRVGLAVNNMGTRFKHTKDIPYSVTLSGGFSPSYSVLKTDVILDIVDITQRFHEDKDWGKRINMGVELNFDLPVLRRFFFRGGLHQGYPSWGLGLDATFIRLDYARYKEEIGAYAGQNADVRHVIELVIGL
jgi:hypothetical protein